MSDARLSPAALIAACRVPDSVPERHAGFRLRYLGDPVLATPCRPVRTIGDIPAGLIAAMKEIAAGSRRPLIDHRRGLGLAANQAGASVALCIVQVRGTGWVVMVNPRIVERSEETTWEQEGCLSIPGFATAKQRHVSVVVAFQDEHLAPSGMALSGVDAQCAQHEIDHLAGVMITDGLSRQQRRRAERAVEKAVAA